MNKSLQSYSPSVVPLDYDSLKSANGCQIISGTKHNETLPFVQICAFDHNAADPDFSLPDTISYFKGPTSTGSTLQPFRHDWAIWVATRGVRMARSGSISLPGDSLGATYGLYPGTKPSKVYGAFNAHGFPVVAIQKDATHIEIKKITNSDGDISTYSFAGISPILFFNGLLVRSDVNENVEVVCFYLDLEDRKAIYARFESENFATEHAINLDLPFTLTRLISTEAHFQLQIIHAVDDLKRDITITSADYAISTSIKSSLNVLLAGGNYFDRAVTSSLPLEKAGLGLSLIGGIYFDAVIDSTSISVEKQTLSILLAGGEYL